MRVEIVNDNQNWLNWGTLVQIWIADPNQRPTTVKEFKDQIGRTQCLWDRCGARQHTGADPELYQRSHRPADDHASQQADGGRQIGDRQTRSV